MSDFPHRLALDRIRDGERLHLIAGEAERSAIAERLGLCSLDRLEAQLALERDGPRIRCRGRLAGLVEQSCVATAEPVPALVDEPFDLQFLPEPGGQRPDDEVELSAEECEIIFHDGQAIDLATALADTLALALDAYPRAAGADQALRQAGVLSEEQASPFAVLARLKKGDPA